MAEVTIIDVIRTKRDGDELTNEQIRWFIERYTARAVADEQAAALLMAIVWRGMSDRELEFWTTAMIDSGIRMDLGSVTRPTVDKHSTGGVGDKISLALCPLVATCGAAVPQLSGRGLGHTGGTLDKMESIAGWDPQVDRDRYLAMLDDPGAVICAAGAELAPADGRLYALRDVTATVESIPLIASSIMSKKIAEGTDALVLDVKFGSGAFMVETGQRPRARPDHGLVGCRQRRPYGGAAHGHGHSPGPHRRQRTRGGRVRGGTGGRRPARRGRTHRGTR